MATKQFLTLDGLTRYDELLKGVMSAEDAKAIKSISVSGNTVSFFKTEDGSGTAYATVNMPDISNLMSKISSATGGKIVTSTATGEVAESGTAISDLMPKGSNWEGNQVAVTNSDGTISEGPPINDLTADVPTIVTGYFSSPSNGDLIVFNSEANATIIDSDVNISDVSNSIAATEGFGSNNTIAYALDGKMDKISVAGGGDQIVISNSDGSVSESDYGIGDFLQYDETIEESSGYFIAYSNSYSKGYRTDFGTETFEAIRAAVYGFDENNTIADFIGSIPQGSSATDVIGYVDEQVDAVEDVADEKTVYIVDNGATSAYAKVYSIYQGSTGSAASPVAGEKLIDINIPKDQVVESGSVADITFHDSKLWDGATDVTALIKGTGTPTAADAGKYIKLVLQNVTDPLYIAAQSLVDIYTAQPNATSVQLTISNTNEISAVIVDGAVTTAKIADGNVTKAKLAQGVQDSLDLADSAVQSVAEGATNGTVAVDGTDVAVHGLGSAAYTASTAYATSAQGALADTALQPSDVQPVSTSDIEALFS